MMKTSRPLTRRNGTFDEKNPRAVTQQGLFSRLFYFISYIFSNRNVDSYPGQNGRVLIGNRTGCSKTRKFSDANLYTRGG